MRDRLALVEIFLSGLAVSYCLLELSELMNFYWTGAHPRAMLLLTALLCPLALGLPASCWLARRISDDIKKRALFVTMVWVGLTAPFGLPIALSLLFNILGLPTGQLHVPIKFSLALRAFETCGLLLAFQALRTVKTAETTEAKGERLSNFEWGVAAAVLALLGICTELFWHSMYR